MQAKDIPNLPVLAFLVKLEATGWGIGANHARPPKNPRDEDGWDAYGRSIYNGMPPDVPEKVALAKMHALIRRDWVHGCTCGCRGDFTITEKGRAVLAQEPK